jgi:hypothetical protein
VNNNAKLIEERFARLVEVMVTEIQAASRNNMQKVNTEARKYQELLATTQCDV